MRNRIAFTLCTTATFVCSFSIAQQDPEFTHFMKNKMYYNPAYAGIESMPKVSLLLRSKWTGYTGTFDAGGSPTSEVLTMTSPVPKLKGGLGAYIMNDHLGALNNLTLQASYAHHFTVKEVALSIGINAGFYTQSINFDKYRPTDPNDPLIQQGKQTQFKPDFGLGVYYKKDKIYGAISIAHFLRPKFNFKSKDLENALEQTLYIMGGYHYNISYTLELEPSILIQSDFKKYLINLGVIATYDDSFWGGVTYKYLESISFIVGMNLLRSNTLQIGYGFDYIVHNQQAKQATSNEIYLSYVLPNNLFSQRKIVRTPRFRY